jgi:hypothetical protein
MENLILNERERELRTDEESVACDKVAGKVLK